MSEITLGNLYDFNKSAMSQLKPLDVIAFNTLTDELSSFIYDKSIAENKTYWMLLNNERRDYTIFIPLTKEGILPELRETLTNRGLVLDIARKEDEDAYEIWIRDDQTNENFVYYMFDYTSAVIKA